MNPPNTSSKLRLKKPYHKEPYGGWHIVVDNVMFRAIGPDELIEKVRQYHLANGRPPRDIMGDLVTFCAARWPHLVEPDYENSRHHVVDPTEMIMVNNLAFSRRPLTKPPEDDVIKRRTQICAGCPNMAPIDGPLADEVRRTSYLLTKGRMAPLGRCIRHKWDCRVAVRWDGDVLKLLSGEQVADCWV